MSCSPVIVNEVFIVMKLDARISSLRLLIAGAIAVLGLAGQAVAQQNGEVKDVAIEKCIVISPKNTTISFVGTHVGDEPKPRRGGFKKFEGFALLDSKTGLPKSLKVEFEIQSIWTDFPDLTKHLMNQDFFEALKFPAAKFKSSRIVWQSKDECTIKGNLSLHGVTKEISFPARVYSEKDGLQMKVRFTLERSKFGMNRMLKGVEDSVSIMVHVGKPTTVPKKEPKEKVKFTDYEILAPGMT